MTPDPNTAKRPVAEPDDVALAALVRATAEDWTLPPQRLDAATWRDRVGTTRGGRRGWLPRLAGPLSAAVVVTIAVAFAAVWLNAPRPGPIAGASPSAAGPSATPAGPSASIPSKVVVNGPLPDPATVLVQGGGTYRLADLAAGALGPRVFGTYSGPTTVVARPGGGWLCVCSDWAGSSPTGPSRMIVKLAIAGPTGQLETETVVRDISGRVDPGLPVTAQTQVVDARASVTGDGRYAFLGWAARHGAEGWQLGIDVIDVAAGRVIGSSQLPALSSATVDGQPTTRIAPDIDVAPSGGAVLVSDFWFVNEDRDPPPSGVDRWSASFDGTTVAGFASAGSTAGDCVVISKGVVDATTSWVLCSVDGRLRFDRVGRDGATIGSTDLSLSDGLPAARVDRSGGQLFVWGPVARTLARIDIATGAISSVTASATASTADPMSGLAAALGRWIAPPALAKVFLDPALAISPDGTRVYALGVDMRSGEAVASRGVFVFDTSTMTEVGHWQPVADLTSIALSPDGAWLYAAGQPLFDAGGTASLDAASISVYATADGSVHLTAGDLGNDPISFPGPALP